jgi:hypothetical protein
LQTKTFKTANELSNYQHDREVQEALRVQSMTDDERFQWLAANWGRLQDGANDLYANVPDVPATARCFATMEEKNIFDRDREVQFALQYKARQAHL